MGWYLRRKAPLVFGHEVVGVIDEVGEGVTAFRPGDRVFVHHHAPCLECRACRRGDFVHCPEWRSSKLIPGGMAETFVVPRGNLERDTLRLPDGLDFERAALIEPTACVVKPLRRARMRGGERVFVIGLGIMGQLHVALARRFGAGEVLATDLEPWRCERARSVGADAVFDAREGDVVRALNEHTHGEMAEVVIVGPGTVDAIEIGLRAAAPGGTVVLFTTTRPEVMLEVSGYDLYFREISIVPSYSCGPEDTREALRRIAEGQIPCDLLITHRFPLEKLDEAYRTAANPRGALKTLVVFPA
jgi:L-iditol 2-dehydrogenase